MAGLQVRIGMALALMAFFAAPALAQDVDTIDRITGQAAPGGAPPRAPDGVKVVAPGALVFARFDANLDGRVSLAEIGAGAVLAFAAADANGDGLITGFEQTDWASRMGSQTDLLANAMTFDIDLDRSVSKEEFAAGLKRIAAQIQPTGELLVADLLQPLSRMNQQAQQGTWPGWGTIRGRGSPPGGGQ